MTEELERSYAGLEGRIAERTDALAHSELALREQTRFLQSVLDCMGDGVVVADATGRFLIFNLVAQRSSAMSRSTRRAASGRGITRSSCPIGSRPSRRWTCR